MTCKAVSFENYFTERSFKLLKVKNFFHWNVSWKLWETVWLEFIVKIHYEINIKLVSHEISWKKNFKMYLFLKPNQYAISTW